MAGNLLIAEQLFSRTDSVLDILDAGKLVPLLLRQDPGNKIKNMTWAEVAHVIAIYKAISHSGINWRW